MHTSVSVLFGPKRLGAFKAPQRLKPTSLIGLCDTCAVCVRWTSSVCRTVGKPCGCIPILEPSHWPPTMDSQSTERHPLPVRFCVPLWSTQNQYFHCVHWRVPRVRSRRSVHTDSRFSKQPDHLFCMRRLFFFSFFLSIPRFMTAPALKHWPGQWPFTIRECAVLDVASTRALSHWLWIYSKW